MTEYFVLSIIKDLGFVKSEINPVVIQTGDGLILFDAGYPNQLPEIESALGAIGFKVSDLKKIVISHHDHDHIGSLKEIKDVNPEIKIVASRFESSFISGEEKSMRLVQAQKHNENLKGKEKEFGERFASYLETINTCPVDECIDDNEYLTEGVKVINTPGHTPGHISLFLEENNVFLAGDALAIEDKKLVIANPQFTLDKKEALRSIEKIRKMHVEKIICYHGNIFEGSIEKDLSEILLKN